VLIGASITADGGPTEVEVSVDGQPSQT